MLGQLGVGTPGSIVIRLLCEGDGPPVNVPGRGRRGKQAPEGIYGADALMRRQGMRVWATTMRDSQDLDEIPQTSRRLFRCYELRGSWARRGAIAISAA